MKRWMRILSLALVIGMTLSLSGCTISYRIGGYTVDQYDTDDMTTPTTLGENVMIYLQADDPAYLNSLAPSNGNYTFDEEWEEWNETVETYGGMQSYEVTTAWDYADTYTVVEVVAQMEEVQIYLDMKFNSNNKLMELYIYLSAEDEEASYVMPDTVYEEDIILNEGTDYELAGKITYPQGAADGETYPAVVLVHGVGSNDMDMSASVTKAYRDLAWSLAEQGIVVIRYDKRTYTYDDWSTEVTTENMTVDWEIVEDAVAATEMLKSNESVNEDQVFIIGHSLGGLVIPRIDESGGDYAGYILMAVPDREWQEAAFDQYLNYGLIDLGDNDDIYYAASYLDSQRKAINNDIDDYTEDELLADYLLGMPAYYWKDLNSYDYIEAFETTDKPMLILQGEADYQILADEDYVGWEEKMEGHENVEMHLYDGLNHLFMVSQGAFKGNAKEYDMPNHVDQEVIDDIAAFVLSNVS